jgi:polyisoprenoid-binding protein YceI
MGPAVKKSRTPGRAGLDLEPDDGDLSRMRCLMIIPVALALGQGAARAESGPYTLDPKASQIAIHVGKSGLFGFAGHEHDVVVGSFHGKVVVDPDEIRRSTVEISIDAASLRVTGQGEPAKDVSDVQATMVGPQCLDVARFPSIRFVSKSVTAAAADPRDLTIRGDLTLHGVTREIAIAVRLERTANSLQATGATTLRQTDFGIEPISKAGVVKVKDELALRWRFVGRR